MRIYYRTGYRYVEPEYKDNRAELEHFIQAIKNVYGSGRLDKVKIESFASPDGGNKANMLLAERRADSLKAYIVRHSGIPEASVEKASGGIAWGLLRQIVAASDIKWKDEVLDVLDNTPLWIFDGSGKIVSGRKKVLMEIDRGNAYRYLYDNIFPTLRSSIAATSMKSRNRPPCLRQKSLQYRKRLSRSLPRNRNHSLGCSLSRNLPLNRYRQPRWEKSSGRCLP